MASGSHWMQEGARHAPSARLYRGKSRHKRHSPLSLRRDWTVRGTPQPLSLALWIFAYIYLSVGERLVPSVDCSAWASVPGVVTACRQEALVHFEWWWHRRCHHASAAGYCSTTPEDLACHLLSLWLRWRVDVCMIPVELADSWALAP